jgi:hypothetical protein
MTDSAESDFDRRLISPCHFSKAFSYFALPPRFWAEVWTRTESSPTRTVQVLSGFNARESRRKTAFIGQRL